MDEVPLELSSSYRQHHRSVPNTIQNVICGVKLLYLSLSIFFFFYLLEDGLSHIPISCIRDLTRRFHLADTKDVCVLSLATLKLK